MTDTPDDIRKRGTQSIDDALARATMLPPSLKDAMRDLLIDAHLPFCIGLAMFDIDDQRGLSDKMRRAATVLVMVNAANEFIRTTFPEDRWESETKALLALFMAAMAEGPLS